MIRRLLALGALVVALVVVAAAPASAHATLLSTEPQNGGVYDTPPAEVKLRFSEPVEVALGGIRVYTSDRERVVTGSPEHPGRRAQSEVAASLPKLSDGTYVVTWRVTSSDSHPIEGAYTFQVGSKATLTKKNAQGVANSLLAATGGSKTVGVLYGIDRAVLFGSLALLIGGAVFLVVVWPRGREDRRARVGGVGGVDRRRGHHRARHRARRGVRGRALAEQGVRPDRVPRRARHALRQGRVRTTRVCSRSCSRSCGGCCTGATATRRARCPRGGWSRRCSSAPGSR